MTQAGDIQTWQSQNTYLDGYKGPFIYYVVSTGMGGWVKMVIFCLLSVKFIYSEKTTKFCEISTLLLTGTT